MNPAAFSAILAGIGGEGLLRTNPVLCIDRLLRQWERSDASWAALPARLRALLSTLHQHAIQVPRQALNRWVADQHVPCEVGTVWATERPAPRVMGLAVDGTDGYVFPLSPAPVDDGWRIDPDLPFTSDQIQDCLAALLRETGISDTRAVPERLAFQFDNATRIPARGDSMTVAAALAVLDQMEGHRHPLLRAAVALVEMQSGARLGSVLDVRKKLAAGRRECGLLSLIVRHPETPEAELDCQSGEVVWTVDSLANLSRELHNAGLLAPLFDAVGPLNKSEAARVLDRLRWLVQKHRNRDASDLGDRVRRCGFAHPPEPAVWMEFARLHAMACRHHGRYEEAAIVSREAYAKVAALGDLGSDDEEADSAAELAASLFSGHRFDEIPPLLQPWADAAAREPRRFRSLTRVKVWNTLGRALAVLGRTGWDDLFGQALTLHRRLEDPDNIDRTTHYRVHARLRYGDLSGARAALREGLGADENRPGSPWTAFLRAKLAQLEHVEWTDEVLEKQLAEGAKPYSVWLYVQAAARQPCRGREDAVCRLETAIGLLASEAGGVKGNVCNLFAAFLEMSVAARTQDTNRWKIALAEVNDFLSVAADHGAYYGPAVVTLPEIPDLNAAEALINRVPYF
jgi:hypothetical protein